MSKVVGLLAALSIALGAPAVAQPRELPVKAGKEYRHRPSGVKLPSALAGLQRSGVTIFAGTDTDVGTNYWSAAGDENLTLYLFRNVSGNVPLWFDRARSTIMLLPAKYPGARSLGIRSFTPPGQGRATGLLETFATNGTFKSTSVMLFPVGDFYVKVRASSKLRDPAALEQLAWSAVSAIDWRSRADAPAASPMTDCATKLPDRAPAALATLSGEDRMMSALLGGVLAQATASKKAPTALAYCREPGPLSGVYGTYRADGATDRYMMALSDAGRAIFVGSSDLAAILGETKKAPQYTVSLADLEQTATYGDFQTLPLPAQALEMVEKTAPISVATTWGDKKRNLTISAN